MELTPLLPVTSAFCARRGHLFRPGNYRNSEEDEAEKDGVCGESLEGVK